MLSSSSPPCRTHIGCSCAAEAAEKAEREGKKAAEAEAEAKAEREAAAAGEEQYKLGSVLLADAEKLQNILAGAAFRKIFERFRKHGCVNSLPHVYTYDTERLIFVWLWGNYCSVSWQ